MMLQSGCLRSENPTAELYSGESLAASGPELEIKGQQ
jgi:hypothetical protein